MQKPKNPGKKPNIGQIHKTENPNTPLCKWMEVWP